MTAEEILNKHIDSSSSEGVVPVVVDAMREFADQQLAEYKAKLIDDILKQKFGMVNHRGETIMVVRADEIEAQKLA